jgi:hypothetical protein
MAIDPIILDQALRTQLPALALGGVGFVLATQSKRLPRGEDAGALRSPVSVWHGVALSVCLAGLLVLLTLAVKVRIVWPVVSSLESVWWVALAGGVVAIAWSALGFGVRGPVREGVPARSAGVRAACAGVVAGLFVLALGLALALPVWERFATWPAQQQLARGAAGLGLGVAIVLGMLALAAPRAAASGWGRVGTLSFIVGMGAQMLALDFENLRLALITGGIASFLFAGAIVVLLRSGTRRVSRVGLLAAAAGAGVVLLNILWQASVFGGASEGSALLYCAAIALALWASTLVARWSERRFATRPLLRELAPLVAGTFVLLPVVAVCVVRSGVLEEPVY